MRIVQRNAHPKDWLVPYLGAARSPDEPKQDSWPHPGESPPELSREGQSERQKTWAQE